MSRIHHVAKIGEPFELRDLLESGGDPNEQLETTGSTPVSSAAQGNHFICVEILANHGADLDLVSQHGTALSAASTFEMKRFLLELGADPDARGPGSLTHAAFFASFFEWDLVELFLEFGADPDAVARNGRTVRELLANRTNLVKRGSLFQPPQIENFLRESSDGLTISPEEYVSRHRQIIFWGFVDSDQIDPALRHWGQRVSAMLQLTSETAEAYRQYLSGRELEAGLKSIRSAERRRAKEREIRQRQVEFATRHPDMKSSTFYL